MAYLLIQLMLVVTVGMALQAVIRIYITSNDKGKGDNNGDDDAEE